MGAGYGKPPGSADIVTGAGGRQLVVGNTCRPHDCYDNNLVFAIDLANNQIWALRQGRGQSPKAKQFIGGPDTGMQQFLLKELAKEFSRTNSAPKWGFSAIRAFLNRLAGIDRK